MILKLRELIEEIKDGVELSFEVEEDASKQIIKILSGESGKIPIKVKIKIVEED
jgi:hypothetical protein